MNGACQDDAIVSGVLLKYGDIADLQTPYEDSALHIAAQHDALAILCNLLLESGAGVDKSSKDDMTPPMAAALYGHTNAATALLKAGAIIGCQCADKDTALRIASEYGYLPIVELLIENGASVDMPNKDGRAPLMVAALEGEANVIEILLKAGANIGFQRPTGGTALRIRGLDPSDEPNGGTALHIAAPHEQVSFAGLFLEKSASVDTSTRRLDATNGRCVEWPREGGRYPSTC
ncbi:Ankyrin repeat [Phytophthora infestans]|uniref:Ankyrin repeat n=1 Tax=Phytophthora infestans TaxID=4787 RepID=A0A833SDX8_PHYIN|nr:Ankyrin repeat [Phytophthora infestans]KAF4130429.1 Ankyrin repeat [Phytophthora infestans]